jgi:hypothetical protein
MFRQVVAIFRGAVDALEATRAMSVLWAYMGYDPSSVARCGQLVTLDGSQSVYAHNTGIARVVYKASTTPLKMATTCRNMSE